MRNRRRVTLATATLVSFFSAAMSVALFGADAEWAPVVFLLPVVAAAFAFSRTTLLYLAALAGAIVLEIKILRAPGPNDLIEAIGWAVLFVAVAALAMQGVDTVRIRDRERVRLRADARLAEIGRHVSENERELHARLIEALQLAVEGNQPQLRGSGDRVAALSLAIAARIGAADREALYVAALLRDIGTLGIDRRIFDAERPLTDEQREVVRQHPALGSAILATLPFLADVSRLVLAHHERWDGGGYPDHAAGDAIPRGARILAVADAYLAMTSDRAWRRALRPSEALGVLVEERGRAYDPAVVDAFVHLAGTGKLGLVDQTIAVQSR